VKIEPVLGCHRGQATDFPANTGLVPGPRLRVRSMTSFMIPGGFSHYTGEQITSTAADRHFPVHDVDPTDFVPMPCQQRFEQLEHRGSVSLPTRTSEDRRDVYWVPPELYGFWVESIGRNEDAASQASRIHRAIEQQRLNATRSRPLARLLPLPLIHRDPDSSRASSSYRQWNCSAPRSFAPRRANCAVKASPGGLHANAPSHYIRIPSAGPAAAPLSVGLLREEVRRDSSRERFAPESVRIPARWGPQS